MKQNNKHAVGYGEERKKRSARFVPKKTEKKNDKKLWWIEYGYKAEKQMLLKTVILAMILAFLRLFPHFHIVLPSATSTSACKTTKINYGNVTECRRNLSEGGRAGYAEWNVIDWLIRNGSVFSPEDSFTSTPINVSKNLFKLIEEKKQKINSCRFKTIESWWE